MAPNGLAADGANDAPRQIPDRCADCTVVSTDGTFLVAWNL